LVDEIRRLPTAVRINAGWHEALGRVGNGGRVAQLVLGQASICTAVDRGHVVLFFERLLRARREQGMDLSDRGVLRVPDNVVTRWIQESTSLPSRLEEVDERGEVLSAEHFIHHGTDAVEVLVTYLHEDRARIGEKIAGDGETITEVGQVAVYAVAPG